MKHHKGIGPSYSDLQDYGFNCLTGEADPTGQRLLFDMNTQGVRILMEFLRVKEMEFWPNMNTTVVESGDAVSSVLLSRGTVYDLMVFIMFNEVKAEWVVYSHEHGEVKGHSEVTSEDLEKIRSAYDNTYCTHKNDLYQTEGVIGNVHQFTGREA